MSGSAGKKWQSELAKTKDHVSGATVRQLTRYKAHSRHAYFTYPCWHDKGRRVIISSDRENRTNLYSVDIESGDMTQLTDWDPAEPPGGAFFMNPVREELFFSRGDSLFALDLDSLETRHLFTRPEGFRGSSASATADGMYICMNCFEDLSDRIHMDLGHGYVGFHEVWEAHPLSMIWKIPVQGGDAECIHEEQSWIGHVNTSPKLSNLITFCHEGPWNKVDNRIWGMDIESGRTWTIRPTDENEAVGHEYWMHDGEHIGYHGRTGGESIYGSIRYDDTDCVEAPFNGHCWHFHSYMLDCIVGDGDAKSPYLMVWRFRESAFEGPKVLAWHRGSFHIQNLHVHPCVNADGTQVLYTADPQGYGQVFLVDIPEFEDLPDLDAVTGSEK